MSNLPSFQQIGVPFQLIHALNGAMMKDFAEFRASKGAKNCYSGLYALSTFMQAIADLLGGMYCMTPVFTCTL
jgi:hypothetical protein